MRKVDVVSLQSHHVEQAAAICAEGLGAEAWSYQAIMREVHNVYSLSYVAVSGELVLGFACAFIVAGECYINIMVVHKDARGMGVGSQLLEALITICRSRKFKFLALEVRASNTVAVTFYEKYGFKQVGRRNGFYRNPPEDALLYTKYIAQDEDDDGVRVFEGGTQNN